MIVVGIDPGTNRIGYAALRRDGEVIRIVRAETIVIPPHTPGGERLALLERELTARLRQDRPGYVAIERLYFEKNRKTALAVAEARGVILLTAHRAVRSIGEYTPLEVKVAVAGYGRADKRQVRRMVSLLLPQAAIPADDDAVDAIAIALTALHLHRVAAR